MRWVAATQPVAPLDSKPQPSLPPPCLNYLLTRLSPHSGSKTRGSLSLAASTAQSSLSHKPAPSFFITEKS